MNIPPYISTPEQMLDLVRLILDKQDIRFSKAVAAKIVGGEYRLEKLVGKGEIRMDKPTSKQNGKWFCNGGDVIQHMKI